MSYNKPLPDTRGIVQTFWDGTQQGRLLIQHCDECGKQVFYPRIVCPHCGGTELTFQEHSGLGQIYSFTVVSKPTHPAFKAEAPYIVALVELDGGGRMMSNIVGCPIEDVHIGMPVQVTFQPVTDTITLPFFSPVKEVQ